MVKRRVGILGGSFDPPTIAHKHLAERFAEVLKLDEVRFVVTRQNPQKKDAYASAEHRWNMILLLIEGNDKFSACDFEIQNDMEYEDGEMIAVESEDPVYTYNTLKAFKMVEPHTEFIFLGGSDILKRFYNWYKAKEIVEEFPIAIAVRPPHNYATTIAPIHELHRDNVTILEHMQMKDIASTDVRLFFETGKIDRAQELVQADVFEYIMTHNLYSSKITVT